MEKQKKENHFQHENFLAVERKQGSEKHSYQKRLAARGRTKTITKRILKPNKIYILLYNMIMLNKQGHILNCSIDTGAFFAPCVNNEIAI